MKIRNGFVSNSSTSSFIIRGICVKEKAFFKAVKKDIEEDDIYTIAEELGLDYHQMDDGDGEVFYIGKDFDSPSDGEVVELPNDLTKEDAEITKILQDAGFTKIKLKTYAGIDVNC